MSTEAAKIEDHRGDIQALIGSGFASLRQCDYLLLQVTEAALARAWIGTLLASGCIRSLADLGGKRPEDEEGAAGEKSEKGGKGNRLETAVALAFSYAGLSALGVCEAADAPFPSAFRQGMASAARARLLGDPPDGRRTWGDVSDEAARHQRVDLLVAHFRVPGAAAACRPLEPAVIDRAGLRIVATVSTCPSYIEEHGAPGTGGPAAFEPFGFRDGVAQPVIKGLRPSSSDHGARRWVAERYEDRMVAAGEFVLGHDNEFGEPAHCPDAKGWQEPPRSATPRPSFGFNGSYLAVRQIRQDAPRLRQFEASHPTPASAPTIVEKMVGRRRDGRSLVSCPYGPAELDAVRFRVDDFDGLQCPRGAHVRRANPRDMLGKDVPSGIAASKLHRLMRRGRVYCGAERACAASTLPSCGDAAHRERCGQGLFFMALGADLDRQFEFIQQRWIASRSFGDLRDEDDPLLGHTGTRSFSMPALPLGRRLEGLESFTEVIGGGYFFVPSLSALRFMA
ncbi:hypothetical protein [Methylibium sp.]|uniref:Dyp-type peroxidase n=1 Tax=Methylibium sp. TaxID=2067992 RepID=UPI0017B61F3A|nr:hypothetical protein [Methylibium sp.]MBA3588377.1 peroxidase [Methylibium sp.]